MSNDKTLATAKHGGCVQLGDGLLPCPFCGNGAEFVPYKNNGLTLKCKSMGCIQLHQRTLRYGIEWLRTSMTEHWNARVLADRLPVADQQPDDVAVDAFAVAMKLKMAEARAKGRSGWEDPAQCTADDLSRMLRDHVDKGDPRDVANFCMMLHQRGEAIAALSAQPSPFETLPPEMRSSSPDYLDYLDARPSPGGQGEVREQFEAWAKANGLETKLYAANGMYSHPVTRGAWIAWQARAAQPSRGIDGYQGAFYELAGMLGMAAQARSPKEVWETQMRPMLRELIAKNQPQAVAPFEAPSLPEGSREAAMVVLERDGPGRPTVWCDPAVVDLVKALNGAGIATVWSCDGHGHRPAVVGLKDGRQLLVLESVEALQQLAHLWPDINGQWRAP